MRLIDITLTLRPGMPTWPGEGGPVLRRLSSIPEDEANVSEITMGLHTGTHVDAPVHFLPGARGVDRIPLEALYGPCYVLQKRGLGHVTADDLRGLPEGVERLLIRTPNSELWSQPLHPFEREFWALAEDAAELVVGRGMRLVGVDYLSIEPFDSPGHPVHHLLLREGVVIVEGLDLRGVQEGGYTLACLPLKLERADGSPCRAVLIAH